MTIDASAVVVSNADGVALEPTAVVIAPIAAEPALPPCKIFENAETTIVAFAGMGAITVLAPVIQRWLGK